MIQLNDNSNAPVLVKLILVKLSTEIIALPALWIAWYTFKLNLLTYEIIN